MLPIRNLLGATLFGAALFAFGAHAQTFETLQRFHGPADGAIPDYGFAVGTTGILYGTTGSGGSYDQKHCGDGCGTIFSVDPETGKFTSLHKFRESIDGIGPNGPLVSDGKGKLYGTTGFGGPGVTSGGGTIFEFDPATKKLTTLYTMIGGTSTAPTAPMTGLVLARGALYGATFGGGANNEGAIYKFDLASKTFAPVYALGGNVGDWMDSSMVVGKDSMIYGTTAFGAKGAGTLFKINPANDRLTVLHAFSFAEGGPVSTKLVVADDGTLFGGNSEGATNENCNDLGCGTIFKFDPATRKLTALHAFTGGADGGFPTGVAISGNGNLLYGQTNYGGAHQHGTVFRINMTTNKLVTMHDFNGPDGAMTEFAQGSLAIGKGGALFGVAPIGGITNTARCKPDGCGTVFQIKP